MITPKKSGKAILTIQSKYNPSVVFTSELYVDMLSEDVFTFSHGYIGYYDGTKKDPDVKIYRSGLTLTEGTDYTATYKGDQVNAGTFTVTFTGIGKYTGSVTKKYTIQPARIYSSSTTCTISPENCIYDGKPQEPNVVITDHGKALTRGKDYTVEYQNNTSIGRARAGITGIGNYSGYFTTAFYISWGSISNCDITLSDTSLTYDGTEKKPPVTVKCNGNTLTEDQDYYLYYRNNTNVGTASVTISGAGNFSGSETKTFQIKASDFSKCDIQLSASSFTYDGTEKKPKITVKSGRKLLVSGTDYTVSCRNNINVGTASVTITGKGKYSGTITKSFSIKPAGFTKASVTLSASSFTWNGAEKKPRVTVKIGNRQLTAGRDYTVSYKNNVSVGTASVTITAKGNYTGSISKKFSITAANFTKTSVSLSVSSFTYDGAEKKPKITVKNGKKQLTANTDYTVSYKNNINAGTASVTITGKGSYSGSQTKNFTITPADLTKTKISLSASSFIYDGAEKKPAITIKAGKKQLTLNKDYTISYKNNTNVGTASVTVTGKGNYTGTISKSFTIAATNLSTADVKLSAASFTYNGKAITPSVTVTCNGKVLTNGTDYSVAYTNNINAGTARVTITGTGAYSGVKTVTFRIKRAKATLTPTAAALTLTQSSRKTAVIKRKKTDGKISLKSSNSKIVKISGTSIIPLSPGKATVTITAAQGKNYNAVSARISISVRPLPVSSLSLKSSAKGQATVSWKQVKSITSYQIQYSTASSMKSARTITVKGASKSAVLKKLTRGKKYYVRIRTVKTVSKKNYYSTWSKTTSVKVK